MLTKSDLQAIKEIVDDRLDIKLEPLKKDVDDIKKQIKPIKHIHRDVKRLLKDRDYMGKTFDEGIVHLGRRVTRIETHLKLAPLKQLVKN